MLRSSGISQKSAALIVRYSQKKKWISTVFYCSENLSIAHNLGTTGLIPGFSAKCTSPKQYLNQIENFKCWMCEFWLISWDPYHNYCYPGICSVRANKYTCNPLLLWLLHDFTYWTLLCMIDHHKITQDKTFEFNHAVSVNFPNLFCNYVMWSSRINWM